MEDAESKLHKRCLSRQLWNILNHDIGTDNIDSTVYLPNLQWLQIQFLDVMDWSTHCCTLSLTDWHPHLNICSPYELNRKLILSWRCDNRMDRTGKSSTKPTSDLYQIASTSISYCLEPKEKDTIDGLVLPMIRTLLPSISFLPNSEHLGF